MGAFLGILQKAADRIAVQEAVRLFLAATESSHGDLVVVAEKAGFDRVVRGNDEHSVPGDRPRNGWVLIEPPQPEARFPKRTARIAAEDDGLVGRHPPGEIAESLMSALNHEYLQAVESLRTLGLLNTATARVAQLLLNVCKASPRSRKRELSAKFLLTQEQVAQMTATTRETVARLLAQLRRDHVISLQGANLVIRDRRALERLLS